MSIDQDQHNIATVIGRFQMYHIGHAPLLKAALESAPLVVVCIGSAYAAPNAKNPFTWQERAAMISATLDEESLARVRFEPIRDYYDNDRWVAAVTNAVRKHSKPGDKIVLVGHLKDASSHYLNRFPGWEFKSTPKVGDIDATSLRQIYFEVDDWGAKQALLKPLLPAPLFDYLKGWANLPLFSRLKTAHHSIEANKKKWGIGPFVTADAVVTASRHVLMVQRKNEPGAGLWAVPGGFLDDRELVKQCAVRELREETGLALLDSTIEKALQEVAVFEHPDRSLRGRTITHAHWFDLGDCRLPEVTPQLEEVLQVRWVPFNELPGMESEMFEDHFMMLDHFIGVLPKD